MINGFKISNTNTQCVHSYHLRKLHNNLILNLDGSEIPVVEHYKFLGVIFDKKLSFIPYIQYLKEKCSKTLKFLRVIVHKAWGAYQHTLRKLYRILIHSKINNEAARKSSLKSLRQSTMRNWDSPFRTSLVECLYPEVYEPPLRLHKIHKIKSTILQ